MQTNLPFIHRLIVPTGIMLLAVIYFFDVQALKNPQDRLLINPIFWIMVFLYPIILWNEWRNWKSRTKLDFKSADKGAEPDEYNVKLTKKVALFMLSVALYLATVNFVGFVVMTLMFIPLLMYILGTKSVKLLILIPILATFVLYMLFGFLLGIPLPVGILI